MQVTLDIPADLLQHPGPAREAYPIAGYRSGALTPPRTRELLGFETRFQLNEFLMDHDIWEGAYRIQEFREDLEGLDRPA